MHDMESFTLNMTTINRRRCSKGTRSYLWLFSCTRGFSR